MSDEVVVAYLCIYEMHRYATTDPPAMGVVEVVGVGLRESRKADMFTRL